MKSLIVFLAAVLLMSSNSGSMAKHRKTVYGPRYYYAVPNFQYLSPGAERMRQAQRTWPGVAMCDVGGYRIVPCDTATRR